MGDLLRIENIKKSFGDHEVLKGVSINIKEGEFITLLGSSGCGKTTLLRIIAGLTECDSGKVYLEGRDVTELPPEKRDVNTVFQSYALFPHMNVEKNIRYGLKLKGMPKAQQQAEVERVLEMVQLAGREKRMPDELSGGQRQRVAIARAIVNRPKVLLLDEPLGALDLKLRRQMQLELKRLQKQLGITFIYITHDQEEALNMSDRIAVINGGVFEEIGEPNQIYNYPGTAYVAGFVGSANLIKGVYMDGCMTFGNVRLPVNTIRYAPEDFETVYCAVRSEYVRLSADDRGIIGVVREKLFSGGLLRLTLDTEVGEIVATRHGTDVPFVEGDRAVISFDRQHSVVVRGEYNGS